MIPQAEISKLAFREGMSDKVIEKDYVITWLLLALANSDLKDYLAFKGGTALKKIYFPDYRYSEDLDFTLRNDIANDEMISKLKEVLDLLAKEHGFQFAVPAEKIEERADSLTAYINFVGPLQARLESRSIKVDFTLSEKLIFPVDSREVHSPYSDAVNRMIPTYSLEEILVEKLCAIIGRTEPRDIYDVNYLFGISDIDFQSVPHAFIEKAEFKGVNPGTLSDSLNNKQDKYERMWGTRLEHQIKELPHLAEVLRELNRNLRKYGLS